MKDITNNTKNYSDYQEDDCMTINIEHIKFDDEIMKEP
jgi:hypothetical protein